MQPIKWPQGSTYGTSAGYTAILIDGWEPLISRRGEMRSVRGYAIPAIAEAEQVYQGELY